jgi:hypothetical protein
MKAIEAKKTVTARTNVIKVQENVEDKSKFKPSDISISRSYFGFYFKMPPNDMITF